MIDRTVEEIKAKIEELWSSESDQKVEVVASPSFVQISISRMYGAPGLSYAILKQLAEFFETEEISDDTWGEGGCESCDYGSKYSVILYIGKKE